jgi:hypothetical protein
MGGPHGGPWLAGPRGGDDPIARIVIDTRHAAESLELLYPHHCLREEGCGADMAGPSKKRMLCVVHDFVDGYGTSAEKPGYRWPADATLKVLDDPLALQVFPTLPPARQRGRRRALVSKRPGGS